MAPDRAGNTTAIGEHAWRRLLPKLIDLLEQVWSAAVHEYLLKIARVHHWHHVGRRSGVLLTALHAVVIGEAP